MKSCEVKRVGFARVTEDRAGGLFSFENVLQIFQWRRSQGHDSVGKNWLPRRLVLPNIHSPFKASPRFG